MKLTSVILAAMVVAASADCYMQNPRGSNDRLNEATANRTNGARMFDSQNNARGGYNAGDISVNAANANGQAFYGGNTRGTDNPTALYAAAYNAAANIQYPMMYYAGSELDMEWTVQHGCGGNEKDDPQQLNCNMVIQYICDQTVKVGATTDLAMSATLVDGLNTNQANSAGVNGGNNCNQAGTATAAQIANRAADNDGNKNGRHESEGWYCQCQMQDRNAGLYTADQNLQGNVAQYTRQNAGGTRRGLECSEERDYYPYWGPTPFRDLAYLTDDRARCDMIAAQTNNVLARGKCVTSPGAGAAAGLNFQKNINSITNENDCVSGAGQWKTQTYGIAAPECGDGVFSRANHLGNGRGTNTDPETAGYKSTIPTWNTLTAGAIPVNIFPAGATAAEDQYAKCVTRLRYNISTDDYDPWNTFASANGANGPVTQNPNVAIGASAKLQLAINTNQFGRTFQDRSHVYFVKKPTGDVARTLDSGLSVVNLNMRGKRGNIVQTFPATEYDYVPTSATVPAGALIHFQTTGSNTHNNGNPGGDGQTGDAGEGTGGTDRHNLVQMKDFADHFPVPFNKMAELGVPDLFAGGCWKANNLSPIGAAGAAGGNLDCALRIATSGYIPTAGAAATQAAMNETLDNTPASTVNGGTIIKIMETAAAGTKYKTMNTRNNNFTNRGNTGAIEVVQATPARRR